MASEVIVTFDGKVFTARKRGCNGLAFGDSEAEAIARVGVLKPRHPQKKILDEPRAKRRGQRVRKPKVSA
jgi:hypothetical protein